MSNNSQLTAPFPYFGGKRRAAALVWERFGEVFTYIEPFAGSLAVLLRKEPMPREIVNDLDGFVTNFWRAVKFDPEQTAFWADMPTCHLTLTAVRRYLGKRIPILEELAEAPDAYDTRLAGYWAWCVSNSIGMPSLTHSVKMPLVHHIPTGRGASTQRKEVPQDERPILNHSGGGIGVQTNRIKIPQGKRPHISHNPGGQGVHAQRWQAPITDNPYSGDRLVPWFSQLATRLARTYILCKDWSDIFSPTLTGLVQGKTGTVGVFFDPPYATKGRKEDLYRVDSMSIAAQVQAKAIELGANPNIRVCVACYIDDYTPFPDDWECVIWTKDGIRMGGQTKRKYSRQECLWFSPYCLRPEVDDAAKTQMQLLSVE